MKTLKYLVPALVTATLVVTVGCSSMKSEKEARTTTYNDRVAARETTREVVTTKAQEPVVVSDNSAVTTTAPAPIAATQPAPAPEMPAERVAKADRG